MLKRIARACLIAATTATAATAASGLCATPAFATSTPAGPTAVKSTATPSAAPPTDKTLTIKIVNGAARAGTGQKATYSITASTTGTDTVRHATIFQMLPPNLKFVSGTGNPQVTPSQISWQVEVHPDTPTVVKMTGEILPVTPNSTQNHADRLSTTACIQADGANQLTACSTSFTTLAEPSSGAGYTIPMIGTALAMAAAGGWTIHRRRNRLSNTRAGVATTVGTSK